VRQNDPKLGELAGLGIDLNRPATHRKRRTSAPVSGVYRLHSPFAEIDDDLFDLTGEFEWNVGVLAHRRAGVLADVEGFI
jgi:hypothetical protein